jgi:hypothetical protein
MNKIRDYFKRNGEEIVTGIVVNLIQRILDMVAAIVVYIIWAYLSKKLDFLGLEGKVGIIPTIIAYVLLIIGTALVIHALYSKIKTLCTPPNKINHQKLEIDDLEAQAKIPTKDYVAYQMGIDIQEFERRFTLIRNDDEIAKHFDDAREALNNILNTQLPQSNVLLSASNEVREALKEINAIMIQFEFHIRSLLGWKNTATQYLRDHTFPPIEIRMPLEEELSSLWGVDEKSLNIKMYSSIGKLVRILNKEKGGTKTIEFDLEKDSDGAYLSAIIGRRGSGNALTWLVLHNGRQPINSCRVVLENLAYRNGIIWEEPYTSIERKSLKWRVGYIPIEGKIDIAAKERVTLELARSTRNPKIKMELSYLDGYSGEFLIEGMYKAFLMIDAKEIEAVHYEVVFEYKTISHLEIKEITKVSE